MTSEITIALDAARQGGQILADYFYNGVTMRNKGVADLVSDADVNAERKIVEVIRSHFPTHSLLGEEETSGDTTAEHLWIIDPLDGTTNFAHHIPHFAVSIAYYRQQKPVCGVIWNPIREDLFLAESGNGATWNGKAIHVGLQQSMSESLIGIGFYYDRGAMMEATLAAVEDCFRQQIHGVRRFGTASLDLAQVAMGCYGAYFEYQLSPWDFAAGRLLVEEAGGKVTTCRGEELPFRKTSVLASNGLLHAPVLAIAAKHLPEAN
ncbi:MAG: inositol monophosphatase [Planctomycetaceae bacterium]|nr:inositol monophosphatase [Planctomycetaceae bacterium]